MKNIFNKRMSALLLAIVLLFTSSSSIFASQTQSNVKPSMDNIVSQLDKAITRGEFAMLINAAFRLQGTADKNFADVPADHPYAADLLCAKGIGYMAGDDKGNANPDKALSGAEGAVILNNLLGYDPSKIAVQASLPIAEWAKPAASVILDLKMVDAKLFAKNILTVSDALALLNALTVAKMFPGSPYEYKQESLKNDFFAYTNRQYLTTATISPGGMFAMSFSSPELVVQTQQAEMLNAILTATDLAKDSDEWKINQLYKMYIDNETRTKSLEMIKPYFDEIKAVKTIDELNNLAKKYANYFNLQPFYSLALHSDARVDATKFAAFVLASSLDLGAKEYYADAESLLPIQQAYRDYLGELLKYIGETDNIEARVNAIYQIEKTRAEKDLPAGSYSDPNVLYKETTWESVLSLTKTTNSLTYQSEIFDIIKQMNVYCPNTDYIAYIESLYTEANLSILKDYALINVLSSFASMLGDDLSELSDGIQTAMYGQIGAKMPIEQRAQSFVTSMMSRVFSRMYSEKYVSENVKKDVTDIVETIRDKYRERIQSLTWMSEETKKEAIIKLDAIKAYVAYPDEPLKNLSYDVKAQADGGNLIDLLISLREVNYKETLEVIKKPVDSNLWESIPTSTVNAFYSPTNNSIIIPAGILQDPLYNPNGSREENLGGIGAIIAHEFTHAFDNSGAQYDKNGTITNWWTEEDYKAFNELTNAVATDLSEINFAAGYYVNGVLCTGETVADLGAMACVLDIADDVPDADLAEVMMSWSSIWAARMSIEVAAYLISADSHAPNKVRVNYILPQMDIFYNTFDITATDGMYVPTEERISIW